MKESDRAAVLDFQQKAAALQTGADGSLANSRKEALTRIQYVPARSSTRSPGPDLKASWHR